MTIDRLHARMRLARRKKALFAAVVAAPLLLAAVRFTGERRWRALDSAHATLRPSHGVVRHAVADPLPRWRASDGGCEWLAPRYAPDPPPRWCLPQTLDDPRLPIHDGIWGGAFPVRKAAGERRIGCFGGSTVEGYPDALEPTSWPAKLEARLRVSDPATQWRVVNFGLAGSSSTPQLARLVHEGLPRDLDVVIIYSAVNDTFQCSYFDDASEDALRNLMFQGDPRVLDGLDPWFGAHQNDWLAVRERLWHDLREHARRIGLDESRLADPQTFTVVHQQVFDRNSAGTGRLRGQFQHRVTQPEVDSSFLATMPPSVLLKGALGRNVRRMLEAALARGVRPILVHDPWGARCVSVSEFACSTYPLQAADLSAYVEHAVGRAWTELGRTYEVPVVDLHAVIAARSDACDHFVDVMHLSDLGLARVAENLVPVVLAETARGAPPAPASPDEAAHEGAPGG